VFHSGGHHIGNAQGNVDGWRDGRPNAYGFWDEDSAYWIDGLTRLGAVLNDSALKARVLADYTSVLENPIGFHNTWETAHNLRSGSAEGWVRSIYSRGMLAYYDLTGNSSILQFLVDSFSNYTAADSKSDRSLTQIEALLEGHSYGGPVSMKDTALSMMATNPMALQFQQYLNSGACLDPSVLDPSYVTPTPAPLMPTPPPTPPGPPPAVCTKYESGKDLSGHGVVYRHANVTLGECCTLCVDMRACGGWVHCPACPLDTGIKTLTSNCFLIGGTVKYRPAGSGTRERTSGIIRDAPSPPPKPAQGTCPVHSDHGE
jgi:hypothetical protein